MSERLGWWKVGRRWVELSEEAGVVAVTEGMNGSSGEVGPLS